MRKDWRRVVFQVGVGIVILACWIGWWANSGFPAPICPGESAKGCLSVDVARDWASQAADAASRVAGFANRWAALIVALFTAILAFFTARLWWSTHKLWNVTNRTLQHAQETSRKELRAYVSVEPLGINEYVGHNYLIGNFRIRNLGKIPAKDISVYSTITLDADEKRKTFPIGTPRISTTVLQPGAEMEFGSDGWQIPAEQLDSNEPLKVAGYLYVWGEVLYTDEFKTAGWTTFCHRYPCDMFGKTKRKEAAGRGADNRRIPPKFARYHEEAGNEAG